MLEQFWPLLLPICHSPATLTSVTTKTVDPCVYKLAWCARLVQNCDRQACSSGGQWSVWWRCWWTQGKSVSTMHVCSTGWTEVQVFSSARFFERKKNLSVGPSGSSRTFKDLQAWTELYFGRNPVTVWLCDRVYMYGWVCMCMRLYVYVYVYVYVYIYIYIYIYTHTHTCACTCIMYNVLCICVTGKQRQ